jgi:hypothetical protein
VSPRYRTIAIFAVLAGAGIFGLLMFALFGYLSDLRIASVSLWPLAIGLLLISIFVASWATAKAKGRSGWLGLVLPFFDVIGLAVLFKLKDRDPERVPRDRGA